MEKKGTTAVTGLILVIFLAVELMWAIVTAVHLSHSVASAIQNIATEIVLIQGIIGAVWVSIKFYDVVFDKVVNWCGLNKAFGEFLWKFIRERRAKREQEGDDD